VWDILTGDALADTGPLATLIEQHVDERMQQAIAAEYHKGRFLLIGTTNLDAQRPVIWNVGEIAASQSPEALELIRKIMLASASIPGAFPPVYIEVEANGKRYREMHVDGGTTTQVFLYPAALDVRKIESQLGFHRSRSVYVLRNARLTPEWAPTEARLTGIAARSISTLIKTQGIGDLYRIYLGTQRDKIAYHLAFIGDDFSVERKEEFDSAYMQALYEYGFNLAKSGYPWRQGPPGFEPPKAARTASR
jgi:predicted acylesterase/phospholipase RssA